METAAKDTEELSQTPGMEATPVQSGQVYKMIGSQEGRRRGECFVAWVTIGHSPADFSKRNAEDAKRLVTWQGRAKIPQWKKKSKNSASSRENGREQ